ncbi:MAG: response regulator [Chloroflexaceae bacterium]|jgi:putative nucleotidyltransferase with HDIG domain|nr:response regulator [Chloroflexaceae bacterium]
MPRATKETEVVSARMRVLIVEDEPTIREICRLFLRPYYDITTAENGRVGLELLRKERFDLVLTDIQMPEMTGLELLCHIREENLDVDVIVLTAYATVDTAKQALKLGALDYLAKPIDGDNLERTVRNCLELRRYRKEKERLSDLVVMYQFSQVIANSLDIETQVAQMTDFLWRRFNPASLAISLYHPEDEELALLIYKLNEGNPRCMNRLTFTDYGNEDRLIETHLRLVGEPSLPETSHIAAAVLRTGDHPVGYLHLTRSLDDAPFDTNDRRLLSVFASQIAASLDNARLYQELKQQNLQTIEALAEAIEARDSYTAGHSKQVTRYAVRLAEVLGLPPERIELIRYAGLLHDIGKIGIHDYILLKPGPLDDGEYATMRTHPLIGGRILRKVRGLRAAVPIVEGHHEQVDGKGYPHGLSGDEMPLEARILAIADAFEAMTADRAYRAAMDDDQALQVLWRGRGTKWDAELVDAFIALIQCEGEHLQPSVRLRQARVPILKPEESLVTVHVDARD